MMKCPTCGARYSASERLCPKDGAVLEHEQSFEDQLIGKTLDGKYRLESFISRGGMGAVFRGMHVMLNRPVAVKMINADLVTSPEIVRRFQREARAATHLNHPNIVDVYDLGQAADGTLYIVMELVTGQSLKEEIRARGALAPARIVHILAQVCDGLSAAHNASIVHRDLKPQNIMLTQDRGGAEVAKIVDFGIAKTFELDANTQLTADGSTLGTPHYMSPEQATGTNVDARSDIYSLGIILYEMLTGEVPFDDPSLPAVLIKHMSEEPAPPSQRRPDLMIPPAMEAIALRCLAKDPAQRYASADEMSSALRAAMTIGAAEATVPLGMPAAASDVTMPLSTPTPAAAKTPAGVPPVPPARPATHPTAPAASVPPPVPLPAMSAPRVSAAPSAAAAPVAAGTPPVAPVPGHVTAGSSRGAFVLVAIFLLLLSVAGAAGYWMWSRTQGKTAPSSSTTNAEPPPAPSTSPAAATSQPTPEANTPSTATPTGIAGTTNATPTTSVATAAPTPAGSNPPSPASPSSASTAAASSSTVASTAASSRPTSATTASASPASSAAAAPTAAPPSPPRPSGSAATARASASDPKPSATAPASASPTPAPPPSATPATTSVRQPAVPENPAVSFQCRGAAEICTPLRSEVQAAFERAGISLRRGGADVNVTAEVTQTDESPQKSFGTDFYVRTYSVQLEADSPRFDNDEIGMPNPAPVRADPRVGAERFNEYARKLAPDVVERVRGFWQRRRQ